MPEPSYPLPNEVVRLAKSTSARTRTSSGPTARVNGKAVPAPAQLLDLFVGLPHAILWEAARDSLDFTYVSKSARAVLGYPARTWLRKGFWEEHLHPENRRETMEARRGAAEQGGGYELEYRVLAADGRVVWLRDSAQPVDGDASRLRGLMIDVTEDKRTERRLSVQYAVTSILAEAGSAEGASPRILEVVCRELDWDLGQLWLAAPGEGRLRLRDSISNGSFTALRFYEKSRRRAFKRGVGLPGRVWASGEPHWLTDIAIDKNFPRAPAAVADGLRSGFGFPITFGARVLGVMEFFSVTRREPDDELLRAFASLGSQMGQLMERTRIEDELRDSENRMKLAMEAGGMGAWEWNVATGEVRWSEGLEAIHGLEPGTFAGTFDAFLQDIHPEDRNGVIAATQRSLETGHHDIEYRIVRLDGAVRWVTGKGQATYGPNGKPARLLGICMDITERKQAVDRQRFLGEASTVLSSSLDYDTVLEQLAQMIVANMADWCAIDVLEPDGSVRRLVLAHADPDKREVATRLEQYHPDPERTRAVLERLEQGEALQFGEVSPEEFTPASVLDETQFEAIRDLGIKSTMVVPLIARQKLLGAITFVSTDSGRRYGDDDLSLAKELAFRAALAFDNAGLYRESQRAQEELRKANETKDEFLGLVSHELRTPITTIYGGARLLRERRAHLDETSQEEILGDIAGETERLHRIVEDLLVLARAELAENMTWEPVLLQRVIETSVRIFRERHRVRTVECNIDPDLQPVAAETTYIEQVLRNLLSNADKYSPGDGPIEVVAERGNGEALVKVLDQGPGIATEEAESIFDRFYRSPGSRGRASGIGLGLTVCKRLIEAQSGRVWARRRETGGLEVGFALPYYADS